MRLRTIHEAASLNDIDNQILAALQELGPISNVDLARHLNLPPSRVYRSLYKMMRPQHLRVRNAKWDFRDYTSAYNLPGEYVIDNSEETAFWRAIRASPGNWVPIGAFADWLDEHNRFDEAKALRSVMKHQTVKFDGDNWRWFGDPLLTDYSTSGWYNIFKSLCHRTKRYGWRVLSWP